MLVICNKAFGDKCNNNKCGHRIPHQPIYEIIPSMGNDRYWCNEQEGECDYKKDEKEMWLSHSVKCIPVIEHKKYLEMIAEKVHNSWWVEKEKQGFHAPIACEKYDGKDTFKKYCDKCHPDMYPYDDLAENIKDFDRTTVKTVLTAMNERM